MFYKIDDIQVCKFDDAINNARHIFVQGKDRMGLKSINYSDMVCNRRLLISLDYSVIKMMKKRLD